MSQIDALGRKPESSVSNFDGFWRWWVGKFGGDDWVRIPWSQFDQSGFAISALTNEWFERNSPNLRMLCAEAPQGASWRDFQGTNVTLNFGSKIAWVSNWTGAAQSHTGAGISVQKECSRCEIEFGLDLVAKDRSDFNPGGSFGPNNIIKDDWFVFIRDHTPFGRDYWIYADTYIVEKKTVPTASGAP